MIERHRIDIVNEIIDYVIEKSIARPPLHMMTDEDVEDLYKELFDIKIRIVSR